MEANVPDLTLIYGMFGLIGLFAMLYIVYERPKWLFLGLVASFAILVGGMEVREFTAIGIVLSPTKAIGMAAFGATALNALRTGNRFFVMVPQAILTALLFAAFFISYMYQGSGDTHWFFQILAHVMFLFMLAFWCSTSKDMAVAKLLFVLALVATSAYSLATGNWPTEGGGSETEGRYIGTMANANRAAQFCLVGVGYAFAIGFVFVRRWQRTLLILAGAILIYLVLLTASRSGLISLLVLSVGLTIVGLKYSKRKIGVVLLILLFSVGAFRYAPSVMRERAVRIPGVGETGREQAIQKMGSRYYQYKLAMELVQTNPLLGIGPGHFSALYGEKYDRPRSLHNIYLTVFHDAGLLGILTYLALLFISGLQIVTVLRRTQHRDIAVLAGTELAILVALAIFGITATSPMEKVYFLTFGFAYCLSSIHRERRNEPPVSDEEQGT